MKSLDKKSLESVKVEEMSGNDASAIEEEIKNKLKEGWTYADNISKGNKIYLVFIK